jgi:hypothetical protein
VRPHRAHLLQTLPPGKTKERSCPNGLSVLRLLSADRIEQTEVELELRKIPARYRPHRDHSLNDQIPILLQKSLPARYLTTGSFLHTSQNKYTKARSKQRGSRRYPMHRLLAPAKPNHLPPFENVQRAFESVLRVSAGERARRRNRVSRCPDEWMMMMDGAKEEGLTLAV